MEVIGFHRPKSIPISFTVELTGEEVGQLEAVLGETTCFEGEKLYEILAILCEDHHLPKWEVKNHRLQLMRD